MTGRFDARAPLLPFLLLLQPVACHPKGAVVVDDTGSGGDDTAPPAPLLSFGTDALDFGVGLLGCTYLRELGLRNTSDEELTLRAIELDAEGFVVTLPPLPVEVGAGESLSLAVRFQPAEVRDYTGVLEVDLGGGLHERLGLLGEGRAWKTVQESWTLPVAPPLDLALLVDQTGSMSDELALLGSYLERFWDDLDALGTDPQIIATPRASGCNTTGILRAFDAASLGVLRNGIFVGYGDPWEKNGMETLATLMARTTAGGCNEGFLRADSLVHLLVFTDEPEASSEPWSTCLAEIVEIVGDAGRVRISAIAPSSVGGYPEVAAATGGVFLDITGRWWEGLDLVAEASIDRPMSFVLGHEPVESTLEVSVNGEACLEGWAWSADTDTIVFEQGRLASGDLVEAAYAVRGGCDGGGDGP
jgi:hypothetical protein